MIDFTLSKKWLVERSILLVLSISSLYGAERFAPNWKSIDSRPTPQWFTDAKFGIFIHWGVYSVPAYAPVLPNNLAYAEWYWHNTTDGKKPGANPVDAGSWAFHKRVYGANYEYKNFAPQFRAELFEPDHWAEVIAQSGAKYVALTSKHHEGFALWPSKDASRVWGRPWNAVETGPHRDVLGDLSEAVRRRNIRMGYYYSLYEWYNPLWLSDKKRYVESVVFPEFKDLVTHYKPDIIFSDGEWEMPSAEWRSPELLAWLFNDSPVREYVVINDRWGKETRHVHGGYWTTEYTAGMANMAHPWEESRGIGFSYGYNRDEKLKDYHTGRQLILMLVDTVSRGGNLLLDIGPAADGTIPVIMEQRLHEIGDWLKVNGEAIYGTKPWRESRQWSEGEQPKVDYNQRYKSEYDVTKLAEAPRGAQAAIDAFYTSKGSDVYAILPRWPGKSFVVKQLGGAKVRSVSMLGGGRPLKWKPQGNGVAVEMPELSGPLMTQAAWVLKISK